MGSRLADRGGDELLVFADGGCLARDFALELATRRQGNERRHSRLSHWSGYHLREGLFDYFPLDDRLAGGEHRLSLEGIASTSD